MIGFLDAIFILFVMRQSIDSDVWLWCAHCMWCHFLDYEDLYAFAQREAKDVETRAGVTISVKGSSRCDSSESVYIEIALEIVVRGITW